MANGRDRDGLEMDAGQGGMRARGREQNRDPFMQRLSTVEDPKQRLSRRDGSSPSVRGTARYQQPPPLRPQSGRASGDEDTGGTRSGGSGRGSHGSGSGSGGIRDDGDGGGVVGDMKNPFAPFDDDDEERGSEYELLLDPDLPEEYIGDGLPSGRDSKGRYDDREKLRSGGHEPTEDDSPYPEVRAAVLNHDQDLPCNTVRAWTIGLLLVFIGASMNTLFSLRQPSIGLGALIAQIIAWPMGHGWAKLMPERHFNTLGLSWSLNPGPFNVKEHSVVVVMASVSFSVAYATDIILAQKVFYKQDFGIPFQLMLTVSTQSLGYGIAGMLRKFLGVVAQTRNPLLTVCR